MPPSNPAPNAPKGSRNAADDPKTQTHVPKSKETDSTVAEGAAAGAGRPQDDKTPTSNSQDIPLGESVEHPLQLGNYRIIKLLGEGGMGAVYEAEDLALKRTVAIKTMRPELASNESARSRFTREARHAGALESDHIVRIYSVGEDRGVPFIAMEFLRGKPLDVWMRNRLPTSPQHILKIGFETALGLAAAHSRGLIHRDIKPANIWLEAPNGRVKILDFGLARSAEADVQLTGTGMVLGTPAYMAPEQARGLAVDHRTDLFSLGCILYQLATGRRPFTGTTTLAVLTSLAVDTPPFPSELNLAIPVALSNLITQLIAKRPEDRPQSAAAVAEELRRIAKGGGSTGGSTAGLPAVGAQPQPVAAPGAAPMATPVAAPVAADGSTVWEDLTVSATGSAPAATPAVRPVQGKRFVPPLYAIAAAAVLLAVGIVFGVWQAMKPSKAPKEPQEEAATEKPPPRGTPRPSGPATVASSAPTIAKVSRRGFAPAELIKPLPAAKPESAITLDHLDPKDIPAAERFDWQPRELVGVIGSHRRRFWEAASLLLSPDNKFVIVNGRTLVDLETLRESDLPRDVLAISTDGKHVLSTDGLWELAQPMKAPVPLAIKLARVQFVNERVVLGWLDNSAVINVLDDKNVKLLRHFPRARSALASATGSCVAVLPEEAEKTVEIYDVARDDTGETLSLRCALPRAEGKGALRVLALSKNRAATIDANNLVHVFDVSKQEAAYLYSIPDPAYTAFFSSDGSRLFANGQSKLGVWDVTGEKPKIVASAPQPGLSPDYFQNLVGTTEGNTLVTSHANGAVRIWSAEKDVLVEREPLLPQSTQATPLNVSQDGRYLATLNELGRPVLYKLSGPGLEKIPAPDDFTGTLYQFSPDGRSIALSGGGGESQGISLWQLGPTGAPQKPQRFGNNSNIAWSPDGKWIASAERDIVVWDVSRTNISERYRIPQTNNGTLRFAPSGQHLLTYSVGDVPTLAVFALTDKQALEQDRIDFLNHSWTVSPDGKTLVRSYSTLDFFDLKDGSITTRFSVAQINPYLVPSFSPDGKFLAVSRGNTVQILDVSDGRVTRSISFPKAGMQVAYHPDGRHLVVMGLNSVIYILRLSEAGDEPKAKTMP
jgi:WD40 repeat protein/tRNA A-37 threonylcarbamoyl transferase component Bud32